MTTQAAPASRARLAVSLASAVVARPALSGTTSNPSALSRSPNKSAPADITNIGTPPMSDHAWASARHRITCPVPMETSASVRKIRVPGVMMCSRLSRHRHGLPRPRSRVNGGVSAEIEFVNCIPLFGCQRRRCADRGYGINLAGMIDANKYVCNSRRVEGSPECQVQYGKPATRGGDAHPFNACGEARHRQYRSTSARQGPSKEHAARADHHVRATRTRFNRPDNILT